MKQQGTSSAPTLHEPGRFWTAAFVSGQLALFVSAVVLVISTKVALVDATICMFALAACSIFSLKIHFRVVRDYRRALSNLEEPNSTDPVSGLAYQTVFAERLRLELARTQRSGWATSLLLVQFDQESDDNSERLLGGVLRASIRDLDLAARFGTEQFVVLLGETDERGAMIVAKRIQSLVKQDLQVVRPLSVCIGVVTSGVAGGTSEDLIAQAQDGLRAAKSKGDGQVAKVETLAKSLPNDLKQVGAAV
jgi:diguanylate cyclase (GGDEF)-like protein